MDQAKYSRYYTYIQPVIKNPLVRSFSPFIFSLISLIIFGVFAIRPTVSTIINLQTEIDNNQQILSALTTKAKNLVEGKNNYNQINLEMKKKIVNLIPPQPLVSSVITSLQNSLSNQGTISALQIQPLTIFDDKATKKYPAELKTIDFTYSISGSYQQISKAIANLSSSPRLLIIDGVIISKQASASTQMNLSGKAFFLRWLVQNNFYILWSLPLSRLLSG